MARLSQEFYEKDCLIVAKVLLGKYLVRSEERRVGKEC